MAKAFTKAMVNTIEEKFRIKLTAEQIAEGRVDLEFTNIIGSTKEVHIRRDTVSAKHICVTANIKGDSYLYIKGYFENDKLKKVLANIY